MAKEDRKNKRSRGADDEEDVPVEEELPIPEFDVSDEEDNDSEAEDRLLEAELGEEADEAVDSDLEFDTNELDPRVIQEFENTGLSDGESDDTDTTYVTGADGRPRPIRPEIDPVYDSDDTDVEEGNTIGNVPLSAYDQMPHIGYDIDGKRIMRPATGSALDQLLEQIDLPEGWTGLLDKNTGQGLNLSSEELELIKKIQRGENPDSNLNPYEPTIEWFSSKTEIMPLTGAPEPKRRFIPSKHEAKRVMKIVRAIREGRIVPNKPKEKEEHFFDVWADNAEPQQDHIMTLRAPKLPPPTHEESYNPPEEYLLDDKEREAWENTHPSDRTRNYLPHKYGSLRRVPGYDNSVRERFERSLDLYLAPRVSKKKLNIDPDSLIPDLPSPRDLRPFPVKCSTIYKGHVGRVRSVACDPTGLFVATGGDDGSVRVWELLTGRELWRLDVVKNDTYEDDEEHDNSSDSVETVSWSPKGGLLSVTAGENIYLVVPPVFDIDVENTARESVEAGWAYATGGNEATASTNVDDDKAGDDDDDDEDEAEVVKKKNVAKWVMPAPRLKDNGVCAVVRCRKTIKKINWHRRGDYFVTVSPEGQHTAVLVHSLSKHTTQSPLRKNRGIVQDAKFHPFEPHLYVADKLHVRVYDLREQKQERKLMPGVRWLSSFDIHPRGYNVITSSYDKRTTWHDMEMGTKPYKTLRYHEKAVRHAAFHKGGLPLFCTASDDGRINVFHGAVYDDLERPPLLVPLKVLKGHEIKSHLGVLHVDWHPKEAWLFSAGADGTARLWTA